MNDRPDLRPAHKPGKRASIALAVAVHLLLAALLFYGIRWQTKMQDVVEVELVQSVPAPAVKPEPAPEPKPEPTEVPEPEPTEVPEPEPTEVPGPGPRTEPTPDIWAVPLDASADPLQIEQLQLVLERWGWLTLAGGEFSAQRGVLDQVTLQAVLDFQLFVNEQYAGVSGRPLVLLDLALENPAIQPDTLKLIMNDQMVEIFKP